MKRLQAGHKAFVEKRSTGVPEGKIATTHPHTMLITCADLPLAPEELFGMYAGELFVHRNFGALVNPDDTGLDAAIHYAIECLKVENLFILAHSECGALEVVGNEELSPPLQMWLYDEGRNGATAEDRARNHGVRQESCLKSHPLVKAAQVTRGLRVMLLFFDAPAGCLEVYEHGAWEPFLGKDQ